MHEAIVRAAAIEAGMSYVDIRKEAHDQQTIASYFNIDGERVREFEDADSHITVYMGRSEREVIIQGHIFVTRRVDGSSVVVVERMTDPKTQREIVKPGEVPRSYEYWFAWGR